MRFAGGSRWQRARRWSGLRLEPLEERTLLAGHTLATATALAFTDFGTARAGAFLATPQEVDLYRVHLRAGDEVSASISAQTAGSGLQGLLRIFDGAGQQVALNDQEGGDPAL